MALGIIVASQVSDSFSFLLKWALPIWFLLLFTRIVLFKRISPKPYFGLITITLFFLIGMINFQKTESRFTTHHFTQAPSEETNQHITLKITEVLKSNVYQDKFVAKVASIDGRPTSGKILLLTPKEKMSQTLSVDDELYVYSEIQLIPKALNPYQFDYKRYLEHQGIFAQVRLSENELIFCGSGASSIKGIAHGFRMFLIQKLQKASIDLNERSILQALVLGYRNDISEETFNKKNPITDWEKLNTLDC